MFKLSKVKRKQKNSEEYVWEEVYGLKAFSPIAKTFPFSHYDDFGASRSYGYSRPHLGHDMMCATGTPVIAVPTNGNGNRFPNGMTLVMMLSFE